MKIILIFGSNPKDHSSEKFREFIEDNELNKVTVLKYNKFKKLAGKYEVDVLPTTFLVSKKGTINQRWENITLPSQLALAIEAELGESHLRKKKNTEFFKK